MNSPAPIPTVLSLPCDACGAAPCGEEDILCVGCRAKVRARRATKLTREQSAKVRSLIDDEGETRASAVAWVLAFEPAVST